MEYINFNVIVNYLQIFNLHVTQFTPIKHPFNAL